MGFSYFRGSAWHCPWQILGETRQLSPAPQLPCPRFAGLHLLPLLLIILPSCLLP